MLQCQTNNKQTYFWKLNANHAQNIVLDFYNPIYFSIEGISAVTAISKSTSGGMSVLGHVILMRYSFKSLCLAQFLMVFVDFFYLKIFLKM